LAQLLFQSLALADIADFGNLLLGFGQARDAQLGGERLAVSALGKEVVGTAVGLLQQVAERLLAAAVE